MTFNKIITLSKNKAFRITRNPHFFFLSIILILGILSPLSFFKHNLPLVGSDTWPPLNIDIRLKEWPYIWGYFSSILGNDFSGRIVFLPQIMVYVFLHFLGFSLAASQRIVFTQIFLTAGFSMYFLSYVLWKKPLTSFISAIIFMFNPVYAGFWQEFLSDALISFSFFPLVLALFIKGIRSNKMVVPAALFSLSTLLFLPYNLPINVMAYGILAIFLVYELFISNHKLKIFKFILVSIFFSLLLNVWWIFPQCIWFPKFMNYYGREMKMQERLVAQGHRAELANSFRLMGNSYWGYSLWDKKPSNYMGFLYNNSPLLIFASFIYPFFAFFSLVFCKKEKRIVFLASCALFFLFLSKALNRPLGGIYQFLFDKFPGFWIFRTPSDKFWLGVLVFYSLLISYSLTQIYIFLKKKYSNLSKIIIGSIVAVFLLFQWPFFTGDVIPNGKSALPSIEFNLPKYYVELENWLREQKDSFRIINLPGANRPTRWLNYKWGFWGVYPILSEILGKPVVEKQPQEPSDILRLSLYYQLGNFSDMSIILDKKVAYNQSIDKALGLLNIKYLLINYDTNWEHLHFGTEDPKTLEDKLIQQKNISFEEEFGNLRIYKVAEKSLFPDIYSYVPGNETYYWGSPKQIGNLFSFEQFPPQSGFFVNDPKTASEGNKIFIGTDYQYFRENYLRNYSDIPSFPYLRFLPGSPFYFIIQQKDLNKEKKFRSDPNQEMDTLISLAEKRLAEIDKLLKRDKFEKTGVNKTFIRYQDLINRVLDIFLRTSANDANSFIKAEQLLLRLNYQENFINNLLSSHSNNKIEKEILISSLTNFEGWYGLLSKYLIPWWFDATKNNRGQVSFSFYIPKEGEYQIYLNSGDLTSLQTNSKGQVMFSGKIKNKLGQEEEFSWLSNGKISPNQWVVVSKKHLEAGDYALTVENQETINLCENCNWRTIENLEISKNLDDEKLSAINFQIKVQHGKTGIAYAWLPTNDINDTYRISFSYRNISGKLLQFIPFKSKYFSFSKEDFLKNFNKNYLLTEKKESQVNDGINKFENSAVHVFPDKGVPLDKEFLWQTKVIDFNPGEGASIFGLAFFVSSDKTFNIDSINEIRGLRVEKVFDNPIILFKDSPKNNIEEKPEIVFKRINPSRYEISVNASKPFGLTFGQSYSPEWKLYFENDARLNGSIVATYDKLNVSESESINKFFEPSFLKIKKKSVPEENHFMINSYANAWLINKTGNYKIILEYYPQVLFYRIGLVSVITLISIGVILIVKKR